MKSSREQFEERFPTPAGTHWNEMYECYTGQSNAPYMALWMGWKASREALVIGLPKLIGDEHGGCMHDAAINDQVILECRAAIEAAGIKVIDDGN